MKGFTYYEEVAVDGKIPETVLAFHDTEFEKQKQIPCYAPISSVVRNPRKIAQEQVEREEGRARIEWQRASSGLPAPPRPVYPPGATDIRGPSKTNAPLPSSTPQARTRPPIGYPPTRGPSTQPEKDPSRMTHPQPATQKLAHPPKTYTSAAQTLPPSSSRPNNSPPTQPPQTAPTQPDKALASQPIPGEIWNLVNEIKGLPTTTTVISRGFPLRKEFKEARFRFHFHSSTGYLRPESPLYRYLGDERLFDSEWWDYLTKQRRKPPVLRSRDGTDGWGQKR